MADGFAIAQVTPFAWERRHEVNEEIARLSDDLAARGHQVVIVAPSTSATAVRDGRKLIRQGPSSCSGSPTASRWCSR